MKLSSSPRCLTSVKRGCWLGGWAQPWSMGRVASVRLSSAPLWADGPFLVGNHLSLQPAVCVASSWAKVPRRRGGAEMARGPWVPPRQSA